MVQRLKNIDYLLFIPFLILSVFGIIMVYSSSSNVAVQNGSSPTGYLIKQTMYVILGIFILYIMNFVRLSVFKSKSMLTFSMGIMAFLLVFVKFFGSSVNGANGWINLGFINLQPAEFVKFFLIIYLSSYISNASRNIANVGVIDGIKNSGKPLLISFGLIGLVLIEPDTGGAAISLFIVMMIFLGSGALNFKKSVTILLSVIGSAYFIIFPLINHGILFKGKYQAQRIVAFMDPFKYLHQSGQQLVNSYYAISNGGLFGVGLGNSIQKTGYLPEPNTDFIMAIATEELGMIFVTFILALLFFIILRCLIIGIRSNDISNTCACYGVAAYLFIQSMFNFGGVTGFLPITGVAFPFISYGGSSMIVLTLSLGLVMNISRRQKKSKQIEKSR
ncbi:FtsW/RodA/SpoVE family cell cycle protein [Lactobacillus sp. S2-2]|uniref:FtsW/RodA/SpoVE family cell cycle protein n=1 Tax=Lactobacillus sp. S2-2 TaxID=2692917 RepID=UPI001F202527|nr:FtsW/RodA/SpoVE family cell cycle protein [Lactobacillus sp. S2-2]MCF6514884.1 FtsW/RodA/SpoVE family cell cycle protein [Lactobacillus sp. S2-2]